MLCCLFMLISCMMFNACVMPWINYSTLNANDNLKRFSEDLFVTHTYGTCMLVKCPNINPNSLAFCLSCSYDWIFKTHKMRMNFHCFLQVKFFFCTALHVWILHVSSGNASQNLQVSFQRVPYCFRMNCPAQWKL